MKIEVEIVDPDRLFAEGLATSVWNSEDFFSSCCAQTVDSVRAYVASRVDDATKGLREDAARDVEDRDKLCRLMKVRLDKARARIAELENRVDSVDPD